MKIMVTGLGGPAGTNVVSMLPEGSVGAVCDADPGKKADLQRLGKGGIRFYTVPHGISREAFVRAVNEIIKRNNIDVVIPCVDEELMVFSYRPEHINARVVVSPYETIRACNDKALLYETVNKEGFCPIYKVAESSHDLSAFGESPLFVKPRTARGSRGAMMFSSASEVPDDLINKGNVFCEYLPGQEYTVDVLCDFQGEPFVIVPRKRLVVAVGKSMRGETMRHPDIEERVKKLCRILRFIGPSNMQFKEAADGAMKLVEINPRFSGGLPITAEAGANTPELLYMLLKGKRPEPPEWREGVFENTLALH